MIDRQNQSGKVTLEDLLRLKRAERPSAAFWTDFDRTLHAKQLAAIVEKRPWWRQPAWLRTTRWSLPLSAAAALAVTFATVGHPTIAKMKSRSNPGQSAVKTASVPSFSAAPASSVATIAPAADSVAVKPSYSISVAQEQRVPAMSIGSMERKSTTPVFTAVAAPVVSVAAVSKNAPSSQNLSMTEQIAGLAVSPDTDASGGHFATVSSRDDSLSGSHVGSYLDKTVARLDLTTRPARAIEPLSQVPTPREARRARLVALLSLPGYDDAADATSTVSRSRERSLSHFNDQALYDAISRLDMKSQHRESAIQF